MMMKNICAALLAAAVPSTCNREKRRKFRHGKDLCGQVNLNSSPIPDPAKPRLQWVIFSKPQSVNQPDSDTGVYEDIVVIDGKTDSSKQSFLHISGYYITSSYDDPLLNPFCRSWYKNVLRITQQKTYTHIPKSTVTSAKQQSRKLQLSSQTKKPLALFLPFATINFAHFHAWSSFLSLHRRRANSRICVSNVSNERKSHSKVSLNLQRIDERRAFPAPTAKSEDSRPRRRS